jgi:hypothetical protein
MLFGVPRLGRFGGVAANDFTSLIVSALFFDARLLKRESAFRFLLMSDGFNLFTLLDRAVAGTIFFM